MAEEMWNVQTSQRGFEYIKFQDHNGQECSLQQSSLAIYEEPGTSAVWLGTDEERMHLTRSQVKQLIVHLKRWIEDGTLQPTQEDTEEIRKILQEEQNQ